MKGEGDCITVSFVLATIVGSKNKNIHLRDFKDVDFNFTRFKFAYFEIEESFGSVISSTFQTWFYRNILVSLVCLRLSSLLFKRFV